MEIIIFIIFVVIAISKNNKKNNPRQSVPNQQRVQTMPNQQRAQAVPNQSRNSYTSTPNTPRTQKSAAELKQEIWERLSEESKAKMRDRDIPQRTVASTQRVNSAYAQGKQTNQPGPEIELTAAEQVAKRRMEERTTSILERARGNAAEHESDVTLETLESEHNHSERVAPAVHNHPEDVIPESMLGSVSDLMVKGYDGNLCFERDFVGEAMDMINRFTAPCEMLDYSVGTAAK